MWQIRVIVLVFVVFFTNCGENNSTKSLSSQDSREEAQKNIILRVQDSVYSNADFERYLKLSLGDEYGNLSDLSLSRLFDDFAEEKLLLEEAQNHEFVLTLEEKKEYLARHSNDSMIEAEERPMDADGEELLYEQLLVEKYTYSLIKDIDVGQEEIQNYYLKHKREFLLPERVKVSQILLSSEEKAVEVLEKVADGNAENFKRLAKDQSIGVEAAKGGEMGVFAMGQLPEEMETVIFALKEGEVSPVLESSYGFHIFRLDSRYEPELIPPDKAASSIELKILGQKVKNHIAVRLEDLKNSLDWEFYPQNLYFPYQRISDE
jgi:hypothetical protein